MLLSQDKQIASTMIFHLCGGAQGRLVSMVGAKDFVYDFKVKRLTFTFKGFRHANKVQIELNNDLYDVTFWKCPLTTKAILAGRAPEIYQKHQSVCSTNLREVFEQTTGLDVSL